jgi:hypothetical protein
MLLHKLCMYINYNTGRTFRNWGTIERNMLANREMRMWGAGSCSEKSTYLLRMRYWVQKIWKLYLHVRSEKRLYMYKIWNLNMCIYGLYKKDKNTYSAWVSFKVCNLLKFSPARFTCVSLRASAIPPPLQHRSSTKFNKKGRGYFALRCICTLYLKCIFDIFENIKKLET